MILIGTPAQTFKPGNDLGGWDRNDPSRYTGILDMSTISVDFRVLVLHLGGKQTGGYVAYRARVVLVLCTQPCAGILSDLTRLLHVLTHS